MGLPRRCAWAALAGLILSFAFEPLALPWLLPFAVAGFVLTTRDLPVRTGWRPGLAFGVAFYFTHIWWMHAVGVSAWLGLAAVEALFYGLLGSVSALVQRHRAWPLWFASSWTAVELLRSGWPFSGMPWGRLAFAVVDTPVARALPYVGMVAVSFLMALLGALLAWVVVGGVDGRLALAALPALLVALAVPAVHPWQPQTTGHATVAVVQGNVPGNGDDILYDFRQVTQNHVDATVELAHQIAQGAAPEPDFVIWPENSTALDPFDDQQIHVQVVTASKAIGVPLVVGAIVDKNHTQVLNQGIVWDPQTGAGDRYTKWHPVPYGEYVPFRRYMHGFNFGRLAVVTRDMLSGTRKEPLDVAGVPVADAICFDVAYDDDITAQMSRGAQLMIVQTSNATFIHTDQIQQQFAITRLRALETGRWVAVASTNGVTGIIAPDGHVVSTLAPRTQGFLDQQVGLVTAVTPAMRIGAWAGRLVTLLTVVGLLAGWLSYRRSQKAGSAAVAAPDDSTSDELLAEPVGGKA